MELKNCTAVITGGVSGLGEATARAIVKAGGKVALLDLDGERGPKLAEELGKSGPLLSGRCHSGKGNGPGGRKNQREPSAPFRPSLTAPV